MSGGAGYVLSSPAVRLLQKTLLQECHLPGLTSYEDVNMGACMAALGVETGDTRDSLGRARFLPYPPWVLMREDFQHHQGYSWLQRMSKFPFNFGIEHVSDRAVSFHEVRDPRDFYTLLYLTSDLKAEPGNSSEFSIKQNGQFTSCLSPPRAGNQDGGKLNDFYADQTSSKSRRDADREHRLSSSTTDNQPHYKIQQVPLNPTPPPCLPSLPTPSFVAPKQNLIGTRTAS
ncbi:putative glycoprotein-N-acetylgalactosamine 3-beta-galactosyltransferase 1-like [Penaeus vannamei]|uniref:Putative glycoprotein-N-acetylgalactosamine 3-beta-galactosyltransferase 1-like n=1 Tax=Penaeus vannamei TaxID=6689 RepID=A0A423SVS6_PENVA|nr:putative glycoprotein-N-acetylgalactosamine 3-beta-galactosyltransferase 1-like [Penaeus vannamei]